MQSYCHKVPEPGYWSSLQFTSRSLCGGDIACCLLDPGVLTKVITLGPAVLVNHVANEYPPTMHVRAVGQLTDVTVRSSSCRSYYHAKDQESSYSMLGIYTEPSHSTSSYALGEGEFLKLSVSPMLQ